MYLDLYNCCETITLRNNIDNVLSSKIPFTDLTKLSSESGVYFIYENNELVYIGESSNIRKRCKQYLQKGSGRTFREKLMKHKKIKSVQLAIKYIKLNCEVRYVIEKKHKKLEHLSIGIFNTIYND